MTKKEEGIPFAKILFSMIIVYSPLICAIIITQNTMPKVIPPLVFLLGMCSAYGVFVMFKLLKQMS